MLAQSNKPPSSVATSMTLMVMVVIVVDIVCFIFIVVIIVILRSSGVTLTAIFSIINICVVVVVAVAMIAAIVIIIIITAIIIVVMSLSILVNPGVKIYCCVLLASQDSSKPKKHQYLVQLDVVLTHWRTKIGLKSKEVRDRLFLKAIHQSGGGYS